MKKIFLLACLALSLNVYSQNYIPQSAASVDKAPVILAYSFPKDANRPGGRLKYPDGTELILSSTCDDPFPWCIKNLDYDEIGFMKLTFEQGGKIAKISIKKNEASSSYLKYLDLLKGTFKKVP